MSNNIEILAVGDISYSRDIKKYIETCNNNDYKSALIYVKKYLQNSDKTIGNLETVISDNGYKNKYQSNFPYFRSSEQSIEGLKDSGIDIVNLANNHINDFGELALNDTIFNLENNGIDTIGIKPKSYKIYNIKSKKIGFIGFARYFKRLEEEKKINKLDYDLNILKELREKVDILIVNVHWGREYKFLNSDKQKNKAVELVKLGADIIIGHHPHVIQNKEIIKTKNRTGYVFYSLGNFLFDSFLKGYGVRNSLILKIKINPKNLDINFEYLPCVIDPKKGYIPIPTQKKFQKEFPEKITNYADSLKNYRESC